ncbi:8076_t:CDS:2, partial [Cetraspora pellucida]
MKKKLRDKLPTVRQKVTIACGSCRKRRSKCSGPPLCLRCKQNNLSCIFITPTNKRGPPKGVPKKPQEKKCEKCDPIEITQTKTEIQAKSDIPQDPPPEVQYPSEPFVLNG